MYANHGWTCSDNPDNSRWSWFVSISLNDGIILFDVQVSPASGGSDKYLGYFNGRDKGAALSYDRRFALLRDNPFSRQNFSTTTGELIYSFLSLSQNWIGNTSPIAIHLGVSFHPSIIYWRCTSEIYFDYVNLQGESDLHTHPLPPIYSTLTPSSLFIYQRFPLDPLIPLLTPEEGISQFPPYRL